jgi:hypothetical protein
MSISNSAYRHPHTHPHIHCRARIIIDVDIIRADGMVLTSGQSDLHAWVRKDMNIGAIYIGDGSLIKVIASRIEYPRNFVESDILEQRCEREAREHARKLQEVQDRISRARGQNHQPRNGEVKP